MNGRAARLSFIFHISANANGFTYVNAHIRAMHARIHYAHIHMHALIIFTFDYQDMRTLLARRHVRAFLLCKIKMILSLA